MKKCIVNRLVNWDSEREEGQGRDATLHVGGEGGDEGRKGSGLAERRGEG